MPNTGHLLPVLFFISTDRSSEGWVDQRQEISGEICGGCLFCEPYKTRKYAVWAESIKQQLAPTG